jgi:hypothetical protein
MADSSVHLRLCVPKAIVKKNLAKHVGQPPGRISQFDSKIVSYSNEGCPPQKIADLLCREHDLDPMIMNRKSLERRLRTIKANGLAKLAPVNEDSDLVAHDAPKRCVLSFFFISFIL